MLIDYARIVTTSNSLDKFRDKFPVKIETDGELALVLSVPDYVQTAIKNRPAGATRIEYLNSEEFLDSVTGYSFFTYFPDKKLVKLFGFDALDQVLLDILAGLPNDVVIHASVPFTSDSFEHKIDILIKQGFSGFRVCETGLCMTRKNTIAKKVNYNREKNNVKYLLLHHLSKNNGCTLSAKLDGSAVVYLRTATRSGSTLNKNGTITQKELAGKLVVKSVNDELVQILAVDEDSVENGDEEQVNVVDGLFNFHTHPASAYEAHNVVMGWPSAQDYIGYITSFFDSGTILHIVAATEGIYVISLGEYWLNSGSKMGDDVSGIIAEKYDLCSNADKKHTPGWYTSRINEITYQGQTLFKVVYFPWETANGIFSVSFPRKMNNCFTDQTLYNDTVGHKK